MWPLWDPFCIQRILCRNMDPFLVGVFYTNWHAVHCMRVGRKGGEPPNLRLSPDEHGVTARAPQGQARA